jgi:hypothetical protein
MPRSLLIALLLVSSAAAAAAGDDRRAYFGDREYPDPYIWDGWSGDGGYRGRAYYARTSPYLTRREWPFYSIHVHRWVVAHDIEALSRP